MFTVDHCNQLLSKVKCQVGLQKCLKVRLMDFAMADLLSFTVFVHRKELDESDALCPEMLTKVLYAHMRAVSIINFCLNPSFTMLEEFCT